MTSWLSIPRHYINPFLNKDINISLVYIPTSNAFLWLYKNTLTFIFERAKHNIVTVFLLVIELT